MHRLMFLIFCGLAAAQYDHQYSTTTPVPILKQINRHNEDGSYSYGYEAADGSYKIESKYPDGEVHGKYGFVDDTGSIREIEYGASRRGFEPSGTGINVPPSTITGNSIASPNEPEDDGQYREDPAVYYTDPKYTNGERYEPVSQRREQQRYRQTYESERYPEYRQSSPRSQYHPENRALPVAPVYDPQPRTQPAYEHYRSPPIAQTRLQGHPASNVNLSAGSYSINYKR